MEGTQNIQVIDNGRAPVKFALRNAYVMTSGLMDAELATHGYLWLTASGTISMQLEDMVDDTYITVSMDPGIYAIIVKKIISATTTIPAANILIGQ